MNRGLGLTRKSGMDGFQKASEEVFHVIKNKIYETLDELEDEVCDCIKQIKIETYQSICNVNYMLNYLLCGHSLRRD